MTGTNADRCHFQTASFLILFRRKAVPKQAEENERNYEKNRDETQYAFAVIIKNAHRLQPSFGNQLAGTEPANICFGVQQPPAMRALDLPELAFPSGQHHILRRQA